MKKSGKAYLIIGTVLVITGLTILSAAAGVAGAAFGDLREEFRGWIWEHSYGGRIEAEEENGVVWEHAEVVEEYSSYAYTQDFNAVDINIKSGNLKVEAGDEFLIEWDSKISSVEYEIDQDGILRVMQELESGINAPRDTRIKITLPESQMYEKISIGTKAGNIELKDIMVDELLIDSVAGKVELEDITAAKTIISSTAGKVDFKGEILESAAIRSVAGNVNVTLDSIFEQYDYDLRVSAGNIAVDGRKYSSKLAGGEYSYSNGTGRKIDISSDAGNIKIEFDD